MPYCAYCGHEISELVVTCPNCGHPNEARTTPGIAAEGPPPPSLQYAGFWSRVAALLIDGILIGIVDYALFGKEVTVLTDVGPITVRQIPPAISTLTFFLYTWLMLGLTRGKTLGKMALGIRIIHASGAPLDLGRAAARQGMAIVSGIPLLLGYVWAAWDPEKRTWHDMVADTRAFRAR